jgi:hypothetical protein
MTALTPIANSGNATRETFCSVPIERLRTTFARLRSPIPRPRQDDLTDLPLRVVATSDDAFEVIDGHKRLERWRAQGRREVPVVLERRRTTEELMALVLVTNAPRRTVTVMDEARVVEALLERPGVGRATAAHLLGRRPWWIERRLALTQRLAPSVQRRVDVGTVRPTVAYALTRVAARDQERLVRAIETHGLTTRDAIALVEVFLALAEESERVALVRDPIAWLRRPPSAPLLGPRAGAISDRLARARAVLADLARGPEVPEGLTDAERRRLEAEWRAVLDQLRETAAVLGTNAVSPDKRQETLNDDARERSGGEAAGALIRVDEQEARPRAEAQALTRTVEADHGGRQARDPAAREGGAPRVARDREAPRGGAGPGAADPRVGAGVVATVGRAEDRPREDQRGAGATARAVPRRRGAQGRQGPHDDADPPRDP